MPKIALTSAALLLAGSVLVAAPQKRVQPKAPTDVTTLLSEADASWKAGKYGACLGKLQEATKLVTIKRVEAILAALPAAPEGWKADADRSVEDLQKNPFANSMMAIAGNVIQRTYRQSSGGGRVQVTVTADSPLVSMMQMWIANPAMLEKGSEMVEYDDGDKAVLKTQGNGLNLQILIDGKHVCEVQASKMTDEELFRMFSQEFVDKLSGALSE